ncbi:hypothetical protein LTR99_000764 [Exophiala xenobiotica]|uniref:Fido domain-containing protein n=1 Tax=Vermiconidia calcicola TaxID=1690605 RepID=A0AAV9QLD5_9PEZI|nr:hypothetical protein LTR96_000581 [Exophiala xenobiotica]KAK5545327.1 hypothetical protein LTR25_000334 [Vermiconidia calcicola]KAK5548076.1 hypothetical protein LTR23_001785 [Chaetothyriales sp. CCFEE 6169]KAK5307792.1 hypothetical protein LTR99_000764 [Exophiala xenobiotica]KAK5343310.1 hypothetical protein LTR98_000939 [Exophiala xenobiotica]
MASLVKLFNEDMEHASQTGTIDPVTIASRYCHYFVNVHPFIDGNGRMCRLLLNTILLKFTGVCISVGVEAKEREDWIMLSWRGNKDWIKEDLNDVPLRKQKSYVELTQLHVQEVHGIAAVEMCRALAAEGDPENQGNNETVNDARAFANDALRYVEGLYSVYSGRNFYDIAAVDPDQFPPNYYIGYLNQPHVQAALGVPVNYTNPGGNSAYSAFQETGDYPRGGYLQDLSYLLDNGIKVAMVYGDRDYASVSLAVNYSHTSDFAAAGYANISVNSSYVGGLVRQYGNFSFSRVFQAGHEVPAYQPETAYEIFRRALFNLDIATGNEDTGKNANFATTGLPDTWSVRGVPHSIIDGSALISDYILLDNYTRTQFPGLTNGTNTNGTGGTGGSGSGSGSGGSSHNSAASIGLSTALWLVMTAAVVAACCF